MTAELMAPDPQRRVSSRLERAQAAARLEALGIAVGSYHVLDDSVQDPSEELKQQQQQGQTSEAERERIRVRLEALELMMKGDA